MTDRRIAAWVVILVALSALADRRVDAAPATQPSSANPFVVSDMQVQTIAGFIYLYDSSETILQKMGEPIGRTIPAIEKEIAGGSSIRSDRWFSFIEI